MNKLNTLNKKHAMTLFICIIVCGVCFLSACSEYKSNTHTTNSVIDTSTKTQKDITAEYIIVLHTNVKIETALKSLKRYDVEVIGLTSVNLRALEYWWRSMA